MVTSFTDYLRQLGPGGEPPDHDTFDTVLDLLRPVLVSELKKRSLWEAPTAYLGVVGGGWNDEGALEELLLDGYEFIFIRRFQGLRNQLRVRDNVDGLVFLNVRHFLHETQKRHDPLGYRVFELLQTAAQRLIDAGRLYVVSGDPRIRNETVLGFTPWADRQPDPGVDLGPRVQVWNNELLPDLVTAWNKERVVSRLEALVAGLGREGVESFELRQLIEPLKADVRARWQAMQVGSEGGTAAALQGGELVSIAPWAGPSQDLERRQAYLHLRECMVDSLDRLRERAKTKDYLRRLWLFLESWAADRATPAAEGGTDAEVAGDRLPPDTQLGKALTIPRDRIPRLKETLGKLVRACLGATSEREIDVESSQDAHLGDSIFAQPSFARGEAGAMDLTQRRERLRLATGEVAEIHGRAMARLEGHGAAARAGDVYVLPASRQLTVEWLVLDVDDAGGRVLLAPIDDLPLVGSRDLELSAEASAGGVATLRCGHAHWLDASLLDEGHRTGRLPPPALERARDAWREVTAGERSSSRSRREVDGDPEYVGWTRQLADAAAALPGSPRPATGTGGLAPSGSRGGSWRRLREGAGYLLAAAFALAAVGLGSRLARLESELSRPIVIPLFGTEIVFLDSERALESTVLEVTSSHVVAHLIVSDFELGADYVVELVEHESGQAVWEWPVDIDQLTVALPRRLLRAAVYRFQLFEVGEDGERKLLDERKVWIELLNPP